VAGLAVILATATHVPANASAAVGGCGAADFQLSAYEGTRVGTVTIEVSVAVARACVIEEISAFFIDSAGQPVAGAIEARATLARSIPRPGDYVVAVLVWDNWCGEHGPRPEGVTVSVDGNHLVVPRLASQPFCRDRQATLGLKVEVSAEPTPLLVPGSLLDRPIPPPDTGTWAQWFDHFVVHADGQVCGTLSLVDPASRNGDGDAVFYLGRPRQPPQCSTAGALVCLETETRGQQAGRTMFKRFTLVPGQAMVLDNFAPDAPQDPGPQPTCSVPNPVPDAPDLGSGLSHDPERGVPPVAVAAALVAAGFALAVAAARRLP
jgi:hypothetical protein